MGLRDFFKSSEDDSGVSLWQPEGQLYPPLFGDVSPGASPGVFVFWHLGVRPQWVYVGGTPNLDEAFEMARDDPDLLAYDLNGGLYAAWAVVEVAGQAGVIAHLREILVPVVTTSTLDALCPVSENTEPLTFAAPEERGLGAS